MTGAVIVGKMESRWMLKAWVIELYRASVVGMANVIVAPGWVFAKVMAVRREPKPLSAVVVTTKALGLWKAPMSG